MEGIDRFDSIRGIPTTGGGGSAISTETIIEKAGYIEKMSIDPTYIGSTQKI